MRWTRCPGCGGVLAEEARVCAGCGADLAGELLPLVASPGLVRPTAVPRRRRRPREGRRAGAFLGAAVTALMVAGTLAGPSDEKEGRPATVLGEVQRRPGGPGVSPGSVEQAASAGPNRPPESIPEGWRWHPSGPLPARQGHVVVWTGTEVVLWGGERPGRTPLGAAYDPKADHWRRIARSPLENRIGASVAWTGAEVMVWGGINGGGLLADGAAYDPAADRWRELAPAPLAGGVPLAAAWTGSEFVVVGSKGYGRTVGLVEGAAYDPRGDTWRSLPDMPVAVNEGAGVWTGRELVVYGGYLDRNRRAITPDDRALGAAYDPVAHHWRRLPTAPISGQALALAWDGAEVVGWDFNLVAAAFDPAWGHWRPLEPVPLERRDCLPAGVGAGTVVFAQHCGQAAIFERTTDTWRPIPSPSPAADPPVFTGEALVVWLGPSGRPHDGTWVRPLA